MKPTYRPVKFYFWLEIYNNLFYDFAKKKKATNKRIAPIPYQGLNFSKYLDFENVVETKMDILFRALMKVSNI